MDGLMPLDFHMIKTYGKFICGVDEVGMGPLAGPVCACAFILDLSKFEHVNKNAFINDSKKLTKIRRGEAFPWIVTAGWVGLGYVKVTEINRIGNINRCGYIARERAYAAVVRKFGSQPSAIVSDFFHIAAPVSCEAVAKADSKSFIVACASIVAKVVRDKYMVKRSKFHPHYGWERNMGYGTKEHIKNIRCFGQMGSHRHYMIHNQVEGGWGALGAR